MIDLASTAPALSLTATIGFVAVGVVLMFLCQLRAPAFFRGETRQTDTPVLVPDA